MPLLRGACAGFAFWHRYGFRVRAVNAAGAGAQTPVVYSVPRPAMPRMTEVAGQRIPLLDEDRQSIIVTIGERDCRISVWWQPSDQAWYGSLEVPTNTPDRLRPAARAELRAARPHRRDPARQRRAPGAGRHRGRTRARRLAPAHACAHVGGGVMAERDGGHRPSWPRSTHPRRSHVSVQSASSRARATRAVWVKEPVRLPGLRQGRPLDDGRGGPNTGRRGAGLMATQTVTGNAKPEQPGCILRRRSGP